MGDPQLTTEILRSTWNNLGLDSGLDIGNRLQKLFDY